MKSRCIELRHTDDSLAVVYLKNQVDKYLKDVASFPSVSIVFLEIPSYSKVEWNTSKGTKKSQ